MVALNTNKTLLFFYHPFWLHSIEMLCSVGPAIPFQRASTPGQVHFKLRKYKFMNAKRESQSFCTLSFPMRARSVQITSHDELNFLSASSTRACAPFPFRLARFPCA